MFDSETVFPYFKRQNPAWLVCCVTQSCPTACDPMDRSPPGFPGHGDSPGKSTELGCHVLLQGIFPTQGIFEPGPPTFQAGSLPYAPPGKPTWLV